MDFILMLSWVSMIIIVLAPIILFVLLAYMLYQEAKEEQGRK